MSRVPLTFSAGVITDATRRARVDGDGREPDNSLGVWPAATNLVPNGSFETGTASWSLVTGHESLTRDTTRSKFGVASGKVAASGSGFAYAIAPGGDFGGLRLGMVGGQTYTFSAWVYVPSGLGISLSDVHLYLYDSDGTGYVGSVSGTPATFDAWQRLVVTRTLRAGAIEAFCRVALDETNLAAVLYVDGVQLEQGPIATPYVHTDGAAATRAAGRVQASASSLNVGLGWAAALVRTGWDSASPPLPASTEPMFWWADDLTHRIKTEFFGGQWRIVCDAPSASGLVNATAVPFAANEPHLVVSAWNPTQLKARVNGNPFAVGANAATLPTIAATTFDLGRRPDVADRWLNGEILWAAVGASDLTDADADVIYRKVAGGTEPTVDELARMGCTGVVRGYAL